MRTLKQIRSEVTPEMALRHIALSYSKKMGGTRKLIVDDEQVAYIDNRDYYSGRGAKYNSLSMHDQQVYRLSKNDYEKRLNEVAKDLFQREKSAAERQKSEKAKAKRIEKAKNDGVYSIRREDWGTFIELSDDEAYGKYFDAKRLAKTLEIEVSDAELLKSHGKTYVFAKSKSGKTYELYHPSLFVNHLSISVEEVTEDRVKEFNHEEWASAPYASEVGQTSNKNHFVC